MRKILFPKQVIKEIKERFWRGEKLTPPQISQEIFGDEDEINRRHVSALFAHLRVGLEKYTGKLFICRNGQYRLIYKADLGEAIEEMTIRRKRVMGALNSFSTPASFVLKNSPEGKQIVTGAIGTLVTQFNDKLKISTLQQLADKSEEE